MDARNLKGERVGVRLELIKTEWPRFNECVSCLFLVGLLYWFAHTQLLPTTPLIMVRSPVHTWLWRLDV